MNYERFEINTEHLLLFFHFLPLGFVIGLIFIKFDRLKSGKNAFYIEVQLLVQPIAAFELVHYKSTECVHNDVVVCICFFLLL